MTALVRLGIRLAGGGGSRDGRLRGVLSAAAGMLAGWFLMNLAAVVEAERLAGRVAYSEQELDRLYPVVLLVFALPIVVLIATISRLSAALRDRRSASLRLLGLTPGQTRVVAGVEAAAPVGLGAIFGVALFYVTRPLVQSSGLAGRNWQGEPVSPSLAVVGLVGLGVPAIAVVVSLLPTARLDPLARARRADAPAPSLLRLVPLASGVAMVGWVVVTVDGYSSHAYAALIVGAALVALGVLVFVPVLVRTLAALLLRATGRPVARIAARRLQSQPAGVARVVSGMLIGLVIVSGAQVVIASFAGAYQVEEIQQRLDDGPLVHQASLGAKAEGRLPATLDELRAVDGVRRVFSPAALRSCQRPNGGFCVYGVVAACADLMSLDPGLANCSDARVAWLGPRPSHWKWDPPTRWRADLGPSVVLPPPSRSLDWQPGPGDPLEAELFIPRELLPGDFDDRGHAEVLVVADPEVTARELTRALQTAVPTASKVRSTLHLGAYTFVRGLQATAWIAAAVILAIGLLSFGISAVDRAIARRAEVVSLQLLGTPAGVLRATQWLEALLSVGVGLPPAVGLGWLCGTGFLRLEDESHPSTVSDLLLLAAVSSVAAVIVASLTVIAASSRIRPELIRTT